MVKLGVNIDHIATLRQARRGLEPDPILAATMCEKAGADSIVAHLREDRRHIQDSDVRKLKKLIQRFNLEMSIHPEIVDFALAIKPHQVTLVPERRRELTTEGGLDVVKSFQRLKKVVASFQKKNIEVSLFVDPDEEQIDYSQKLGVEAIELHTGVYANALNSSAQKRELSKLTAMTQHARSLGLIVNAGHGLNYVNTTAVAKIEGMNELNIGHSIISRAAFVGMVQAVKEMKKLL